MNLDDDRHAPLPQRGCNVCVCGRVATDPTYHTDDDALANQATQDRS